MIKSASSISEKTGESIQTIVSALEKISSSDDNVGTIIDNLIKRDQQEAPETKKSSNSSTEEESIAAAITAEEENANQVRPAELVVPEGRDPSLAPEALAAAFAGDLDRYVYSRYGNPTVAMLQKRLAALEGAESCLAMGTGMAAMFMA
ncbi:MAG: hypothetical protein EBZ18_06785, partial [Alphaproteobacteria bacterium]|nr:hypothetical protein [Alphaproteobacteria bacterium]